MVWSVAALVGFTVALPDSAGAEALVRFINGREIVVREHWFDGAQILFTHGRGTVGVPREFVAAIEPVDSARGIGGGPRAVNAPTLVAPEPIR
jgi:hypothetical protein